MPRRSKGGTKRRGKNGGKGYNPNRAGDGRFGTGSKKISPKKAKVLKYKAREQKLRQKIKATKLAAKGASASEKSKLKKKHEKLVAKFEKNKEKLKKAKAARKLEKIKERDEAKKAKVEAKTQKKLQAEKLKAETKKAKHEASTEHQELQRKKQEAEVQKIKAEAKKQEAEAEKLKAEAEKIKADTSSDDIGVTDFSDMSPHEQKIAKAFALTTVVKHYPSTGATDYSVTADGAILATIRTPGRYGDQYIITNEGSSSRADSMEAAKARLHENVKRSVSARAKLIAEKYDQASLDDAIKRKDAIATRQQTRALLLENDITLRSVIHNPHGNSLAFKDLTPGVQGLCHHDGSISLSHDADRRTAIHEELHASFFSNGVGSSYRQHGAVIEEVVVESMARRLSGIPYGSYQTQISDMKYIVSRNGGTQDLAGVGMRMLKIGSPSYKTTEELTAAFVSHIKPLNTSQFLEEIERLRIR